MSVEIRNESMVDIDATTLVDLANHVLATMGVHPQAELSVLLVGVEAMESYHVRYLDEPGPTDVMAFPMDEISTSRGPSDDDELEPTLLGDVVLCPQVARTQAAEAGHSMDDELHVLCTHGILHLLGYDHAEDDEAKEMFDLQGQVLAEWKAARSGADPAPGGAAPAAPAGP